MRHSKANVVGVVEMMHRSKRLRDSANGAPCAMLGPNCTGISAAWRHSNHGQHGKGTGIKAHDLFGFYGCQPCEDWYCTTERENRLPAFLLAWQRSMLWACENGAIRG